jgi:hypothetical protein
MRTAMSGGHRHAHQSSHSPSGNDDDSQVDEITAAPPTNKRHPTARHTVMLC